MRLKGFRRERNFLGLLQKVCRFFDAFGIFFYFIQRGCEGQAGVRIGTESNSRDDSDFLGRKRGG